MSTIKSMSARPDEQPRKWSRTQMGFWNLGQVLLVVYVVYQLAILGVSTFSHDASTTHLTTPHWAPGTNLSMYFFLSSSPSADVFVKTRKAPEMEARRKKKAEMRANGYIGHGQYRKPLRPEDPDYEQQMEIRRRMQERAEQRKARQEAEMAARAIDGGDASGSATPADPHGAPHSGGHGGHGHGGPPGRPQGGFSAFLKEPKKLPADFPSFVWHNIIYGDFNDKREADLEIEVPFSVQRNSPIYAEVFITVNGSHPDPVHPEYVKENVHHTRTMLTEFFPRTPAERRESENRAAAMMMQLPSDFDRNEIHHSHWHPNFTITLVSDSFSLEYDKLPASARKHVDIVPNKWGSSSNDRFYFPIVYPQMFWRLRSQMSPVDVTITRLPLHVTFYPTSLRNFKTYASISDSFEKTTNNVPEFVGAGLTELKRLIVETPSLFLAATTLIGLLNLVRWCLDIDSFPERNSAVPQSRKSILMTLFARLVVFVYLFQHETQSRVILLWEAGAVFTQAKKLLSADAATTTDDKTASDGTLGSQLATHAAIDSVIACLAYWLLFENSESEVWYSFTLRMLTVFIYVYGFIEKLIPLITDRRESNATRIGSTAMLLYALSVVNDDCIAYTLSTPMLYRLATFRNDIVFLVMFYKWYTSKTPTKKQE